MTPLNSSSGGWLMSSPRLLACFSLAHQTSKRRVCSVKSPAHGRLGQVQHLRDLLRRQLLAALELHGGPLLRRERFHGFPELAHAALRHQGLRGIDKGRRHPLHRALSLTLRLATPPADELAPSFPLPRLIEAAI